MKSYDVIIVGGGISGTAAAISASRKGAKTLLVEQYGFLGGMLTAGGVGPMMTFHAGDKQVIQGVTGELIDRLVAKGKSPGHIIDTTKYTYTVTPFDAESMKHEMEMMLLESGGDILYHSMLADVNVIANRIKSIVVCNKSGLTEISARVFIDATGDADLSAWAGLEFTKGRGNDCICQPVTMNMKMRNVDIQAVKQYARDDSQNFLRIQGDEQILDAASRLSIAGFIREINDAKKNKEITFNRECILFFETNNSGEVIINTTRVCGVDSTQPWSLSMAEVEGRKQVRELEALLKKKITGFENAELIYSGPSIGVRNSRQIKGMYMLTHQDILSCKAFTDVIAHAGYPVDIHSPDGEGTNHMHLKWGDMYSIPYRCLVNKKIGNLITVGRCISATFEAQAAIRTSPTAGAIGHAGGAAAYLSVEHNCEAHEVNIKMLQDIIKEQGGYLEI